MLSIILGFFHLLMGLCMFKYKITDTFYNKMLETEVFAYEINKDGILNA